MVHLGQTPEPSPSSSGHSIIEEPRQTLSTRYDIIEQEVVLRSTSFLIAMVRDTNVLVDEIDPATFAVDERLPYWAELWPSSIGLAEDILDSQSVSGKKVLELGCGLGLAGIAAAKAGAQVVLNDYEEDALLFARSNVVRNLGLCADDGAVSLKKMDWREPEEIGVFDLVLGADILYEERNFSPLLTVLEKTLAPEGFALFADPGRAVAKGFVRLARASAFRVEERPRNVVYRCRESSLVLYTLRRTAVGCIQETIRE